MGYITWQGNDCMTGYCLKGCSVIKFLENISNQDAMQYKIRIKIWRKSQKELLKCNISPLKNFLFTFHHSRQDGTEIAEPFPTQ